MGESETDGLTTTTTTSHVIHRLPIFLYIKPPDELTLAELLPDDHIWTAGMGGSKEAYLSGCKKLSTCTEALYTLQKHLMEKLLDNDDGEPSSLKIFGHKLRNYVVENSVEHRTIYFLEGHYTSPTQPAVALSFLCILLDIVKMLFERESSATMPFVPSRIFYDGSHKYFHFDRIGGGLSHLKRHYRHKLIAHLGSDHPVLQNSSDHMQSNYNDVELSDICTDSFLI